MRSVSCSQGGDGGDVGDGSGDGGGGEGICEVSEDAAPPRCPHGVAAVDRRGSGGMASDGGGGGGDERFRPKLSAGWKWRDLSP